MLSQDADIDGNGPTYPNTNTSPLRLHKTSFFQIKSGSGIVFAKIRLVNDKNSLNVASW